MAGTGLNDKLRSAFFLTLLILAVEAAGSLLSHSLTLLSDAGHVLSDAVAIALAWYAAIRARRDCTRTARLHALGDVGASAGVILGGLVISPTRSGRHPRPCRWSWPTARGRSCTATFTVARMPISIANMAEAMHSGLGERKSAMPGPGAQASGAHTRTGWP
jgi:hypothetical protein